MSLLTLHPDNYSTGEQVVAYLAGAISGTLSVFGSIALIQYIVRRQYAILAHEQQVAKQGPKKQIACATNTTSNNSERTHTLTIADSSLRDPATISTATTTTTTTATQKAARKSQHKQKARRIIPSLLMELRIVLMQALAQLVTALLFCFWDFFIPRDFPDYWLNFGTTASCSFQGWMQQTSLVSAVGYLVALAAHHLSTMSWGWSDVATKEYERWIHLVALGFPSITATISLIVGAFNPSRTLGCFYADSPLGCHHQQSDGDSSTSLCDRGEDAYLLAWFFAGLPLLVSFVFFVYVVVVLRAYIQQLFELLGGMRDETSVVHAGITGTESSDQSSSGAAAAAAAGRKSSQHQIRANNQSHPEDPRHASMLRFVALEQDSVLTVTLYVVAFFVTHFMLFVCIIYDQMAASPPFAIRFLHNLLWPLQGFLNFLIFFRPRIAQLRKSSQQGHEHDESSQHRPVITCWEAAYQIIFFQSQHHHPPSHTLLAHIQDDGDNHGQGNNSSEGHLTTYAVCSSSINARSDLSLSWTDTDVHKVRQLARVMSSRRMLGSSANTDFGMPSRNVSLGSKKSNMVFRKPPRQQSSLVSGGEALKDASQQTGFVSVVAAPNVLLVEQVAGADVECASGTQATEFKREKSASEHDVPSVESDGGEEVSAVNTVLLARVVVEEEEEEGNDGSVSEISMAESKKSTSEHNPSSLLGTSDSDHQTERNDSVTSWSNMDWSRRPPDAFHQFAIVDSQHTSTSWSKLDWSQHMDWSRRPPEANHQFAIVDSQHTATSWSKLDLSQHSQLDIMTSFPQRKINLAAPDGTTPLPHQQAPRRTARLNSSDDISVASFGGETLESSSPERRFSRRASTGSSASSERKFPRRASMESGLQSISESHIGFGGGNNDDVQGSRGTSPNGISRHIHSARSSMNSRSYGGSSFSVARSRNNSRRSSMESLGSRSSGIPRHINAARGDHSVRGSVDSASFGSWSTLSLVDIMWNDDNNNNNNAEEEEMPYDQGNSSSTIVPTHHESSSSTHGILSNLPQDLTPRMLDSVLEVEFEDSRAELGGANGDSTLGIEHSPQRSLRSWGPGGGGGGKHSSWSNISISDMFALPPPDLPALMYRPPNRYDKQPMSDHGLDGHQDIRGVGGGVVAECQGKPSTQQPLSTNMPTSSMGMRSSTHSFCLDSVTENEKEDSTHVSYNGDDEMDIIEESHGKPITKQPLSTTMAMGMRSSTHSFCLDSVTENEKEDSMHTNYHGDDEMDKIGALSQ